MKYLICLLFSHDLEPVESLTPYSTKMLCRRCQNLYAQRIADERETLCLWTDGMETSLRLRRQVERMLACKGVR